MKTKFYAILALLMCNVVAFAQGPTIDDNGEYFPPVNPPSDDDPVASFGTTWLWLALVGIIYAGFKLNKMYKKSTL